MAQTRDGADAVLAKIAELAAFQDVATRLHEVITGANPDLVPRLWYGMPGYALAKSKPVLVFFRVDDTERVTLGVTEHATHWREDGADHQLMPSAWFLTGLDAPTEARVAEIVRRATA